MSILERVSKAKKVKKASPLKAPALRNPGQSLEDEIRRLLAEELPSYLALATVFCVVAVIEWIRAYSKLPPMQWPWTILALLACAWATYKLLTIRRKIRLLRQAKEGEKAVGQYLEALREKGYKVLHDVLAGKFNLDHVLVGPSGVYVIETKTISKPVKGDASVEYDGEKVTVAGFSPDRDPVMQAKALGKWLGELIKESTGKSFKVRPVVLYPGWFVTEQPRNSEVWVLNPKALPSFLDHEDKSMTQDDVHLVSYHLSRYVRTRNVP